MKSIRILFLAVNLVSTAHLFAQSNQTDPKRAATASQSFTILDKGVKRIQHIQITKSLTVSTSDPSIRTVSPNIKKGIIIGFKENSSVSLDAFEEKYGLKLKKKMRIGYYLFENVSEANDMEIITRIIAEEDSVKTVKPNWKKQNIPR